MKKNITKRKDGRLVKTITINNKKIYFYGKTEREINQKILNYSEKEDKGKKFKSIAENWWEEAEQNLSKQTVKSYKIALNNAIKEFGNEYINQIKAKDINKYLNKFEKRNYSFKTVANQKLICNLIFNYAIKEDYIEFNPCASIKISKNLPKEKRTSASKTDEEIIKKRTDLWLLPLFALLSGLRKGEILALKWKDIDFEKNIIKVTKSIYIFGNKSIIKSPKTEKGKRIVPLLIPLKTELLKQNRNDEYYIFTDDGINPLSEKRFYTKWKEYKKETGITCTTHQLRHSFATFAFECGVPLKSAQEILGHAQSSTTLDIYTDFRKESFDSAANLLNKKLS